MGAVHAGQVSGTPGLTLTAVCDLLSERREKAAQKYPGIAIFESVEQMLAAGITDLCVVATPHNTHVALAIQCLQAGQHVIVEKPMAITTRECTQMIEAAREAGKMLSVFHQRRCDGDYVATKEVVRRGLVGDVFHVEMFWGRYHKRTGPARSWRALKAVSGGIFYDLGAHMVDWACGLLPGRIAGVTGVLHKKRGAPDTNEDQGQILIRFEGGETADLQISSIARAPKAWRRVLGTRGSVLQDQETDKHIRVFAEVKGVDAAMDVPVEEGPYHLFYRSVADHVHRGKPLLVTAEDARRVIAVIEAAQRSAVSGRTEQVEFE